MAKRWQIGPYIALKSNRKWRTASSFMRFPPYFYFRFGQKWLWWHMLARNARITLRSRKQTCAECYGSSADDRNTIYGSTGSEYSTSQVTGSNILPSRGFQIVDLRVETAAFAVLVKPEVAVFRPEVVLRDRKWFRPAQIQRFRSRRVWSSFLFRFCIHYFCAYDGRDRATVTRTVRPMLRDRCPVCLSVTLVYCGQSAGWTKMPLGTDVGLGMAALLDGDQAPLTSWPTLLWHGRPSQQLLRSCLLLLPFTVSKVWTNKHGYNDFGWSFYFRIGWIWAIQIWYAQTNNHGKH